MEKMIGLKQDGEVVWVDYLEFLAEVMWKEIGHEMDREELREKLIELDQLIVGTFNEMVSKATG